MSFCQNKIKCLEEAFVGIEGFFEFVGNTLNSCFAGDAQFHENTGVQLLNGDFLFCKERKETGKINNVR